MDILMRQAAALQARSGMSMKLVHVGARREHADHDYGGARVSRDVMALAEDPEIDVVSICSYDDVHTEQAVSSLENGKHVMIEKPVAGDVLIFPCGYTHTHRGNPPIGGTKYLVTSWGLVQNAN